MRRLIVLAAVAFALMLLLPGTAQVGPPLVGQVALDYHDDNPIWRGTISGDIAGQIFFSNIGGKDAGKTYHFAETWMIKDGDTVLLAGTDDGVVSPDSKYRMNGVVTYAAPVWSHLLGGDIHASGYITWDPDTGAPLTAPGTFRIN
jgi:hypothetical protein